jgi:aspartate racemase
MLPRIGLIAGLGPESTLEYYRGLIDSFKGSYKKTGYPEIIIVSLDMKRFIEYADAGDWGMITRWIASECERLRSLKCDFGAICSNTPHKVFDEIQARTKLPLVSIVDSSLAYAKKKGHMRLGLLGTKTTMSSTFYQDRFNGEGITLIVPTKAEQKYLHRKLFSEIEFGIFKKQTIREFHKIGSRLVEKNELDGLLLACTELPLVIKQDDIDTELIDTMKIHVKAIAEKCTRGRD